MFGCVVFRWLLRCASIRFERSCFSVFIVSVIILGSCWLDSFVICWCISDNLSSEIQSFIFIVLTWSANLWLVIFNLMPDFYHSFSIASFRRVAPKITIKCKFVVFSSPFSVFVSTLSGCLVRCSWTWKKNSHDADRGPSFLQSRKHLSIMTPTNLLSGFHVEFFISIFFSWVIHQGYTRPRGCLISDHLSQMWTSTLAVSKLWSWSQKKHSLVNESKSGDFSLGWTEGSPFNSYNAEV